MITQAACLISINGGSPQIIPLHRHGDIGIILKAFGFKPSEGYKILKQGFIDEMGNFYNREDALKIVIKCGQKSLPQNQTELFSEDLY